MWTFCFYPESSGQMHRWLAVRLMVRSLFTSCSLVVFCVRFFRTRGRRSYPFSLSPPFRSGISQPVVGIHRSAGTATGLVNKHDAWRELCETQPLLYRCRIEMWTLVKPQVRHVDVSQERPCSSEQPFSSSTSSFMLPCLRDVNSFGFGEYAGEWCKWKWGQSGKVCCFQANVKIPNTSLHQSPHTCSVSSKLPGSRHFHLVLNFVFVLIYHAYRNA